MEITLEWLLKNTNRLLLDSTKIVIFYTGHRVASGSWFEDSVLGYADRNILKFEYSVETDTMRIWLAH